MTLEIINYADWVVKDARQDCEDKGLTLEITNSEVPAQQVDLAVIEKNTEDAQPGTTVSAGDTVSVVIFPLEPRQKS